MEGFLLQPERERQDFDEAVSGIQKGYSDIEAGRTRPVAELLCELREEYGIPR